MRLPLLLILLCASCVQAAIDVSPVRWEQRLGASLPLQLEFTDERGATVTLQRYFAGRPVVVVFVYFSCPELCPQVLTGIAEVLQASGMRIGSDYELVAVSIDPRDRWQDTQKQRLHIVADRGFRDGIHLLTTPDGGAAALATAAGFHYRLDEQHAQFAHAAGFIVADDKGEISRYFLGVRYPADEVRNALVAAKNGRIGTLADRLLLLCYHFDPEQGRYTLALLNLLRAFVVASVLVAAAWAWRAFGGNRPAP